MSHSLPAAVDTAQPTRLLFVIPPYFNLDDYLGDCRGAVVPAFTLPYGIMSMSAYVTQVCRRGETRPILGQ